MHIGRYASAGDELEKVEKEADLLAVQQTAASGLEISVVGSTSQ